ncbi:hypothetical protein S40288_00693 [Stachybotrys chartarum IBT 40288]|nr:hypothetical protein S40288_00693 [Stachybotrys chartarum IBT 40288]
MNITLPHRTNPGRRTQPESGGGGGGGGSYFNTYTSPSSTEAINGPVREPAREQPPISDRLIVGVDFGTTFSGVAAVYTSTPDDVEIIKTWPGGNGITSDKVPTEIAYEYPPNAAPGATPAVKWGFQFKPDQSRLRCIKLFLDRSQKLPFYVSPLDTAAQLKKFNKNVVDAVSDYLTQIYKHTMDTLTRRYGESFMASTKVEFVLTCPAVWSDAAKNTTLQAAERAGMGSRSEIQMISEPEAAAVYTLKAIQPNHLNIGDNFIVCDAGGGTVDLIAYKIISLKPLRVEESAVGTGGLCGSAFLNYRFEEHVRSRLGQARFDEMKNKKGKTWQMGLKYFEEFVKRNFNEDEHQEVNVPFPGLPDDEEAGLDSGFMVMTADQIKDIFAPVVKEVCDLVRGQVDGLRGKGGIVSGIVLVGGFGQSDYLYKRLKTHFTSAAPPPYSERPTHANAVATQENGSIEVMQPVYAWTAVVRGAVLRGLEGNMVISRKSRMHYGTSYATVYDEDKHSVSERYWSPLWERWMVSDRMQWHIAKVSVKTPPLSRIPRKLEEGTADSEQGEALSPLSPIAFHYTRNFRPGQSLIVTDDLIACAAEEPPAAFNRDLVHVCTLTTDLNAVPRSLFTRLTTTRGVEFDNLDFTLEMIVDSAGLGFELKVDGVRRGPTISTHTHGRHQNPSLPFLFLVAATQTTSFPQSKIFFFLFCVYIYYCNFLYLVYARFFSISFIPKRENQTPLRTSKFQEETSEETENRRLADFTLFWVCLAAMETRSRRPSLQRAKRRLSSASSREETLRERFLKAESARAASSNGAADKQEAVDGGVIKAESGDEEAVEDVPVAEQTPEPEPEPEPEPKPTPEEMLDDLVAWVQQKNSEIHPLVEAFFDRDMGMGLRVKPKWRRAVAPNEPIVKLNTELSLSYVNALPGPARSNHPLHKKLVDGLEPHVVGRVVLVKEMMLGSKSKWFPYIRALPQLREGFLPPWWDRELTKLIRGTNVDVARQEMREQVDKEAATAWFLFRDLEKASLPVTRAQFEKYYAWAYCIFTSRSFRPSLVLTGTHLNYLPEGVGKDDFSVLLPYFDLGNHDKRASVTWERDEELHVTLKIDQHFKPGQQIFNNYGTKTNAELLLAYNFTLPPTDEIHYDYVHVRKRLAGRVEEYYMSLRPMSHPSSVIGREKQAAHFVELTAYEHVLPAFQHVQLAMVWDIFCDNVAPTPAERERLIPVSPAVAERLRQYRAADPSERLDLADFTEPAANGAPVQDAPEPIEPSERELFQQMLFFTGQVNEECFGCVQKVAYVIWYKARQELRKLDDEKPRRRDPFLGADHQQLKDVAMAYKESVREILENTMRAVKNDDVLQMGDDL